MTEFMEQFLLECRELVEQASADLLALEKAPRDRERLDGVFRAIHTLKGAAGIMDFHAMSRALHAAEDVLAATRTSGEPVSPSLVEDGLYVLDQITRWLDVSEVTGELPADADASADAVAARFGAGTGPAPAAGTRAEDWLDDLLARHPDAVSAAAGLRYAPDPACFFRGEDPLALVEALPGLLALEVAPASPWPDLESLDPFACNLVILALLSGSAEEAQAALRPVEAQVEIRELPRASLSEPARAVLEAQLLLLAESGTDGAAGRMASAGRVAANVLRHAGRPEEARVIDRAAKESLAAGDHAGLRAAIRRARDGAALLADGPSPAPAAPATPDEDASVATAPVAPESAARVLRVAAERIDALVTLAGELTVAKNALAHAADLAREGADPATLAVLLRNQHAGLDRLVGQLQQAVRSVRILPLGHVFGRFPRLVRELAASLGKPARILIEGEATEADKAVVEALFEPVLHAVRNALDHGIEPAAEREARGKPAVATIRLRAARHGEQVRVEVEDDGRGIDAATVRAAAARRGLLEPGALAALDDEQAIDLVFMPGFSTASSVTDLSGRGVGMDAVRRAVERMGGRVALESIPGRGTTLRMTLPFSVMLTRVMTVEVGRQVFGIPLDGVVETVRIARDRIVPVGSARAFVLRDRTVPLLDLAEALGATTAHADASELHVVVVAMADQLGGLAVDRLGVQMDVMLKPMDGLLAGVPAIAGTTLLGDGRVLLVLDPQELLA